MFAEMYSFNDIVMATWDSLRNKEFIRNDTNEYLGSVYAKYDKMWSLATICTNGRVEFINQDHNNVKRVFGEDLNTDKKMFFVQTKL